MPKRQYANPMQLRQHLSTTSSTYDAIYGRAVLHVDAWLYQSPRDVLHFLFLSMAGGQDVVSRQAFRAEPGALIPVEYSPALAAEGVERTIDGPWARANAPWLATVHRDYIQPRIRERPEGFRAVSVWLHYVHTDLGISDPLAGIENMYGLTGYADQWPARPVAALVDTEDGKGDTDSREGGKTFKWHARDRSKLRTLDKLLK